MPGLPGAEAIRRLGDRAPCTRVVVLTVSAEGPDMTDAMLSGAAGYVLKDDLPEHIVEAVRAAAAGERGDLAARRGRAADASAPPRRPRRGSSATSSACSSSWPTAGRARRSSRRS